MKALVLTGLGALALAATYSITSLLDPDIHSRWGIVPGKFVSGAAPGVFYEVPRGTGANAITPLCLYSNLADAGGVPSGSRRRETARFVNTIGHTWPILSTAYGLAEHAELPFRASFEVSYEVDQLPHTFLGSIDDPCMDKVREAFENRASTVCVVESVLLASNEETYVRFKPWAIVPPVASDAIAAALPALDKLCPLRQPTWLLWPIKEPIVE